MTDARSDPLVEALAATVATHRVRRVRLAELRRAFAVHDPTGATSSDSRTRLAAAIEELQVRGAITLPRSPSLYERHVAPALPQWVERPPAARSDRGTAPARIWRPELTRAASLAASAADYDTLTRVDAFLRAGGSTRQIVPHRERSVQIFGNEKRLDQLLRTKLFIEGALSLALLRCYVPPLPLTAQHTGDPGPDPDLLIVENHATYSSVLRLARERATIGRPALAAGYGAGNQLPRAIGGIIQLEPVPVHVWYFGDLDEDGLAIANAAAVITQQASLPPLRPAMPLYRALLDIGHRQRVEQPVDPDRARRLATWFEDPAISAEAVELLISGRRIAQESVGYEVLSELDPWI